MTDPVRMAGRSWISLASLMVLAASLGGAALSCRGDAAPLGLPDGYLLIGRIPVSDNARRPLPLVTPVPVDDAATAPVHKLLALGFPAEVLRTHYLCKQFVREVKLAGPAFSPVARRLAVEPTLFMVNATDELGQGLAVKPDWPWQEPRDRPALSWVGLPAELEKDTALGQTLVGRMGRRIARDIGSGGDPSHAPPPEVLVDGYAQALEVIAREWRLGEGPQGAMASDAGTPAQRELFAAVRQNRFATGPDGRGVRPATEMLRDPGLVATVLYRFAQAKVVGHRVAPPELYAPFVTQRIPDGISPAAVLGPFRNFQAKLIAVWGGAVLRGKPPADIIDLVEAYAAELPAERQEVIRLFVITTLGATVKEGGVVEGLPSAAGRSGGVLPELTALAAEVAAGRRSLRQALGGK